MLAARLGSEPDKILNVGQFAKERGLLGDWDEKYQTHEMKEDELLDTLEPSLGQG